MARKPKVVENVSAGGPIGEFPLDGFDQTTHDVPPIIDPGAGSAGALDPEPVASFTPAECKNLYMVLGELEILVAMKLFRASPAIARQVFTYGPDELDQLAEPTAVVLNKYSTSWVRERKDELTLLFGFIAIHQAKIGRLMELTAMQRESVAPGNQPVNGVQA